MACGLVANLGERHIGREFHQRQSRSAAAVASKDGEICDDKVDGRYAGQRQSAALDELGAAVLACVLHQDNDAANAGHEVHRPSHPL